MQKLNGNVTCSSKSSKRVSFRRCNTYSKALIAPKESRGNAKVKRYFTPNNSEIVDSGSECKSKLIVFYFQLLLENREQLQKLACSKSREEI